MSSFIFPKLMATYKISAIKSIIFENKVIFKESSNISLTGKFNNKSILT